MAFSHIGFLMEISVSIRVMSVRGGVSEMQLINIRNPMATLTIAHVGKIIIEYEL